MGEAGIFAQDDRLELIEGEIFEMSPVGRRHAACVRRLTNLLARQLGAEAILDAQNPLHLSDFSQPQPDLVLLRPREDFYSDRHPGARDVLLLIEVSETSLRYDRELKVPLYARCGIPEVWLVDLEGHAVEIFREPGGAGYAKTQRLTGPTEALVPVGLPGLQVRLADVLG